MAGVILLALVATVMRVNNARVLAIDYGFDANWNWEYVEHLQDSWALPVPHDGWSFAQPPLFFYASAAVARVMDAPKRDVVVAIRTASSVAGLLAIAAAVFLVARAAPEDRRRWLLAAGLLLFLPMHIYVSAMLTQEILVSSLVSLALVGVALQLADPPPMRRAVWSAAGLGLVAGLALLTKLSGALAVAAVCATWTLDGLRRREPARGLACALAFGAAACVVGGWPYVRNLVEFGYLYPYDLQVHAVMHTMPPGERALVDYLRVPLATFTMPFALHPQLIHSVWGTTFTTIWYDGHRVVLPRWDQDIMRLGSAMLLLALLPTAAFAVGLWRGLRRAFARPGGIDTLFLLLVVFTVAGYTAFTWRNPWYATLKGSYLLGLLVPFGFYASEVLADWVRRPGLRQGFVWTALVALLTLSAAVFTLDLVFAKKEGPGYRWERLDRHGPPSAMLQQVPEPSEAGPEAQAHGLPQRAVEQVEPDWPLPARHPSGALPASLPGALGDAVEEGELLIEAQAALGLERRGTPGVAAVGVRLPS